MNLNVKSQSTLRPCLFLDRDGIVIKNVPYSKDPTTVELMLGIVDLIRQAQAKSFLVIVVTNQSGIGRGLLTLEDYRKMTERMEALLAQEGIHLDHIYFSPFYEKSQSVEFLQNPHWRKPGTGMVEQACRDFAIDLQHSLMIGDRSSDMEMAFAAQIPRRILLESEDFKNEKLQIPKAITFEAVSALAQIKIY